MPSVGQHSPTVWWENEILWMIPRPRARMAKWTTALDHTNSKMSQDVKSVKDWNGAQGKASATD